MNPFYSVLQASKLLRSGGASIALARQKLLPLLGPPTGFGSAGDLDLELMCCMEQTCFASAQVHWLYTGCFWLPPSPFAVTSPW